MPAVLHTKSESSASRSSAARLSPGCPRSGERQGSVARCHQSDQQATLGCMQAFGTTDFRHDLTRITVPTLVIHGDSDATVPFEGSGRRTHEAVAGPELVVVQDAPHGFNVSHAQEFNAALLEFLER